MKGIRRLAIFLVLGAAGIILPAATAMNKPAIAEETKYKRLILKDGSYELIREFSIRGDRVHYFSTERNEWEDLPYSLIDWAATEEFAGTNSLRQAERANEALDRAAKERMDEGVQFPVVAPGLRLPSPDGVFLLDVYHGKPALSPINQSGADLNKNTGRNILRGIVNPIASSKQTIELPGLHSHAQSHTATPSIYVSIDSSDPLQGYTSETAKDHLRIVRCEQQKDKRVVGAINIAVYGKAKQSTQYIEAIVEPISKYWAKVTPANTLEPGEYALVEFDEKGAMNQFVWDFGMDPDAPQNSNIVHPGLDRNRPVLIQKPKTK
jgi:hypothetical protein